MTDARRGEEERSTPATPLDWDKGLVNKGTLACYFQCIPKLLNLETLFTKEINSLIDPRNDAYIMPVSAFPSRRYDASASPTRKSYMETKSNKCFTFSYLFHI